MKHKIKSSYNLLTNGGLYSERIATYTALSEQLLSGKLEIDVLVDWSPCIHHNNQLLKASVVLRGKTMTLYEEVHPEEKLGNYEVHKSFLNKLKLIIPANIRVTVMTDAGFRTEWFKLITKLGWDFTGRVRSNILFQQIGGDSWTNCTSEYQFATNTATYRGEVLLSKENQLQCFLYLYKELNHNKPTPKGFHLLLTSFSGDIKLFNPPKNKPILIKNNQKYYLHGNSEGKVWRLTELDPQVIAQMSLIFPDKNGNTKEQKICATNAVKKYSKRMKIEHEFRSTKNPQYGIGLSYSRSMDPKILQVLLLIGQLYLFLLWLIGLATEYEKKHFDYQANTVKTHRVLSLVFLGMQVILHDIDWITDEVLLNALTWGKIDEK